MIVFYWGCTPTFTRKWELQYEVIKQTQEPITYNVSFTNKNGATKSQGPISDAIWRSEIMEDAESSLNVALRVKILSGSGILELRILRDGAVHESKILESPEYEAIAETSL